MKLLRKLTAVQDDQGWLSDETLRHIAAEENVSLYHLEGLVSFYPHFRRQPPKATPVHVCRDVVCRMNGGPSVCAKLREQLSGRDDVELEEVSCLGQCDSAPALMVNEHPLAPSTLSELDIVQQAIAQGVQVEEFETIPPGSFACDPYSTAEERYGTVAQMVSAELDELKSTCIDNLTVAGLRGMGGAGFPTGKKWELVAAEQSQTKYVICNADESEPGTFKDRVILEQLPHLVLEGMLLAGLTIGAEQGIIYLRHEYVAARARLEEEIATARSRGILGENAAGSGRAFDVEIFVSPGGYILGEETALLEALEDKRGEPRNKPPYPGQHGLWGKPTLINNVETYALATSIIHHGPDWWAEQGVGDCKGIKFVCISGDITDPGVYEIPVGTTIEELIDLAGGIKDDRALKAFLPGGASTAFLPEEKADTPIDFDAMKQAGSALGTGAVVIFDETRDLFDLATNLVAFFRNESCGKCVPCRVGSQRAVEMLEAIQSGDADESALSLLPVLGETLEQTSICGLGQVALVPILSMLELDQ